jgi:Acetyltransferase (GNAT) family
VPSGFELIPPTTEVELLSVRIIQHEAYGGPEPPGPSDIESLRHALAAGGGAVLAQTASGAVPAGAGEYSPPFGGVTEITSVGVRPEYRRRGMVAAMTVWLVRKSLEHDIPNVFLMANEAEGASMLGLDSSRTDRFSTSDQLHEVERLSAQTRSGRGIPGGRTCRGLGTGR